MLLSDAQKVYIGNQQISKAYLFSTEIYPKRTIDPNGNLVSLLLHMDGTDGSTTFTDSSLNNLTITNNGPATISTTITKTGFNQSGRFGTSPTTTRYLVTPSSSLFAFGSGDYTVEMFVYRTLQQNICRFMGTSQWSFELGNQSSGTKWTAGGLNRFVTTGAPTLSTWVHVAVVRQNTTISLYYDGVLKTSGTDPINYTTTTGLTVGDFASPNQFAYVGYMDELRITKGLARYTSNFVPPTAPFPNPG